MSRSLRLIVLLLTVATVAQAQWERIEMDDKGGNVSTGKHTPGAPHPLKYFLTPTAERDPSDTLLIANPGKDAGGITLSNYRIEVTQKDLGSAFGRKVLEIDSKFWTKQGLAADTLFHGGNASSASAPEESDERPPAVEWKSLVVESSPGVFREVYLIIDDGMFIRPLKPARILRIDDTELLATTDDMEGNGGYCTEGYWVLRQDGPWLLDFTPVRNAIARVVPANAAAMQMGCWAMSIEKQTISAPVQEKNADCHACGWLGHADVKFKIERHQAVPVTVKFEQNAEE